MSDQTNYIYQTIISDMSEGLVVIGFDGVITHMNEAAEIILDKKREKLIGKKFASCFILFEENDEFNQVIIDSIYDRTKSHKKIVSYYNGKSFKELNITTSFLHNNGQKVGIVIVLSDISELVELRDAVKAMERIKKLNTQLEMRNELLSATFGRFLSDEIVKELLDTPGGLQIGGKKRNITILMSDLRSFTTISESLDPSSLIDMLNHYLSVISEIVDEHKGTIIEFLGDGILIIFGAPIENKKHALNAVLAAIKMQSAMPSINEWNKQKGYPILKMGIGINTGETIVGNIGSEKRTKYGVIGKHVNLCGRIESYTIGGQILISPYTKSLIDESLEISKEFEVSPKGLSSSIVLSEVTGIKGEYNIYCPKIILDVKPLKFCHEVIFSKLEGKYIVQNNIKGEIVGVSDTHALLLTKIKLLPFTDIEIHSKTSGIYCKIIDEIEDNYLCAFTNDPSPLLEEIYNQ